MTSQNKLNERNSINIILETILFFIIIAGTLYIVSVVLPIFFPDKGNFLQLSQEFKIIGIGIFSFLKPVVKLILILFISNWILRKFGVKLTSSTTVIDWNIQAFVGVIITFVFVIAVLLI